MTRKLTIAMPLHDVARARPAPPLLTPSLKIRRKQVEERYRDRIEAMYAAG